MNVWVVLVLVGMIAVGVIGSYWLRDCGKRNEANQGTAELTLIETDVLAAEPVPESQAVFIADPESGETAQEHRDGIRWMDAPIPPRLHRCFVQTRGWSNMFTRVHRCACGAIRMDGGPWLRRNERKQMTP